MAYNDDAVLARLSSLNESHDSIATAAQWIMFHRFVFILNTSIRTLLTAFLQTTCGSNGTTLAPAAERLFEFQAPQPCLSCKRYDRHQILAFYSNS